MFNAGTEYDVIVVGGRPAGSTTAARFGKQGLRVLLLERSQFPSLPAVSSPIIFAPTMALLDEIGADEAAYARSTPRIYRMRSTLAPGAQFDIAFPDYKGRNYAYAVDRARFDAALWDAALRYPTVRGQQGVSVTDLLRDDDIVCGVLLRDADGQTRQVRAGLVVGADGRHSLVARKAQAASYDEHHDTPTTLYYAYWRGLLPYDASGEPTSAAYGGTRPGIGYLVMDSADDSAAVVIEGRSDLLDDAGGDAAAFYTARLREQPELWARLENAERVTTVRGIKRVGNRYRQAGGPGWALVGDAYHQKDPLDGQGIYNAVFSAKALADAAARYRRGELLTWEDAVAYYDETFRIRTYAMYRALLARVNAALYADAQPPEWLMNSVGRWVLDDPILQDLMGRFMVRQIPSDAVTLMTAPVVAQALLRGSLLAGLRRAGLGTVADGVNSAADRVMGRA